MKLSAKLKNIIINVLLVILFVWAVASFIFQLPKSVSVVMLLIGIALLFYNIKEVKVKGVKGEAKDEIKADSVPGDAADSSDVDKDI